MVGQRKKPAKLGVIGKKNGGGKDRGKVGEEQN